MKLQSHCHDEKPLTPRIRRTKGRAHPCRSTKTCPALDLTNIQDGNIGLHLQIPRGGTHPNGVGSELTIFFARIFVLLQLVSFTVDSDPL